MNRHLHQQLYCCLHCPAKTPQCSQRNAGRRSAPTATVFANVNPYQLTGFSLAGSTWSGAGVSASGLFTPAKALVGTQTLTYTYSANGCTVTATKQITIPNPPALPLVIVIAPDTLVSSVSGESYEWKQNGITLPFPVHTRKINATASGLYAVKVINTTNGPSIYSQNFNILIPGIKERSDVKIKLYPNPSTGLLNLGSSHKKDCQITVFNT